MRILCLGIFLFFVSLVLIPSVSASELLGAGATFPYPFYSKVFKSYNEKTGERINYQAIGSGGGIRQLLSKTVDFGATDAFMKKDELKQSKEEIIHIPTCMGAVAIAYNLPGNPGIKLSGKLVSEIFSGNIKKWNDPKIIKLNPGVKVPSLKIIPVYRSDGSGTTFIFSDYLSKVSEEWKKDMGAAKVLKWRSGIGAKGNAGIAGTIKNLPGSIGYIEFVYAKSNKIPVAKIKNSSGKFMLPSIDSISSAANTPIPPDTRVSITNTKAENGYPISSFTWLIFYREQKYSDHKPLQAASLKKLLYYVIGEGQKFAPALNYAPLPENVRKLSRTLIDKMTYDSKVVAVN